MNPWIVLDCRSQLERLTITDREQVICRIENLESGRPIGDDDLANAALIASAPELRSVLRDLIEIERRDNLTDPDQLATEAYREATWDRARLLLENTNG